MQTLIDPHETRNGLSAAPNPRLATVGKTPLIRLQTLTKHLPPSVEVYVKAEHLNPGGSIKDRPARRMIAEGLRSGTLGHGQTLIDATSGNTGIAYAMLCAPLGIPVTLALPANASQARMQILRAYGAKLLLTDPMEGTDGAQQEVKARVAHDPETYFYPDQYNNDANWQAHFYETGVEILEQTRGRITHFVASLGTTGTFVGVTRRLKTADPDIRCIAIQPDSPLHGIEGLKHLETAIVPGIYDAELADDTMSCTSEESLEMMRRLAREEGLFVGPSSGCNVAGALRLAQTLDAGLIVTVLCDTGMRYLGESSWD